MRRLTRNSGPPPPLCLTAGAGQAFAPLLRGKGALTPDPCGCFRYAPGAFVIFADAPRAHSALP